MKNWIQLRKKQIAFISALLFAECLPLVGFPELAENGWGFWTMMVLVLACIMLAVDAVIPVIKQAFKK